ncbi:MAG: alkaline phosphatase family protein, partial [Ilumatobacteraceae bacterium]
SADLEGSAFTEAHLRGTRPCGWRVPSGIIAETSSLVRAGESFVYVYYDGLDKTAHERGFGAHYDAELAFIDWLIGALMEALPTDTTVAVTADHGQVHVGPAIVELPKELLDDVHHQSGEGRFRWLHARRGRIGDVLARAEELFSDRAWVVGRDRILDERWFGPATGGTVSEAVLRRFGDVALIPFADISFDDPLDSGPISLVCRHGSLTSAEMMVPLAARRVGASSARPERSLIA